MPGIELVMPTGEEAVEVLSSEARALAPEAVKTRFNLPYKVLIDEGFETGRFAAQYYHRDDEAGAPGFEDVDFRIPPQLVQRVVTLSAAANEQRYRALFGRQAGGARGDFEEGERCLRGIKRTLEFLYDDGVETEEDEQLAALAGEHDDTASMANLSAALYDYARLGQANLDELAKVKVFDPSTLDRALELSQKLKVPAPKPDRAELDLRNRFLTLLEAEIQRIRAAAAYLWQDGHPEIYHLFTSGYRRQLRLARRRRQTGSEAPAPTTPELVDA